MKTQTIATSVATSAATSIDSLTGLLLESARHNVAIKALKDSSDKALESLNLISETLPAIVPVEPDLVCMPTPEQFVLQTASYLVTERVGTLVLRHATIDFLKGVVNALTGKPEETVKAITASIRRSQKHIITHLTAYDTPPHWVYSENSEYYSLRITFDQRDKVATLSKHREKSLTLDHRIQYGTEKILFTDCNTLTVSKNDGISWLPKSVDLLDKIDKAHVKNEGLKKLAEKLKEQVAKATIEVLKFKTKDGFSGFDGSDYETIYSLLERAGDSDDAIKLRKDTKDAHVSYVAAFEATNRETIDSVEKLEAAKTLLESRPKLVEDLELLDNLRLVNESMRTEKAQILDSLVQARDERDLLASKLYEANNLVESLKAEISRLESEKAASPVKAVQKGRKKA